MKRLGRRVRGKLMSLCRPVMARFPRLGLLYYFFEGSFNAEVRAILHGQMVFERTLDRGGEGQRYTLRRNTHRLEKGLIMRPQRGAFAEKYIGETVALFLSHAAAAQDRSCEESQRLLAAWAGDVLRRYFQTVPAGLSAAIDEARCKFDQAMTGASEAKAAHVPYQRDLSGPTVDYPSLVRLAQRRRSVRWYLPKPVPRDLIDNAVKVAALSPSACNRQPFEFRVFDDPALVRQVAGIPGGARGFHSSFPCVAVLIGKLRALPHERDRHIIYIDASLAAMAFQFALEAQGLSSCCINWNDNERQEKRVARALDLAADERVVMLLSLGYPDPAGQVPYSMKKSLDELRSYNRT